MLVGCWLIALAADTSQDGATPSFFISSPDYQPAGFLAAFTASRGRHASDSRQAVSVAAQAFSYDGQQPQPLFHQLPCRFQE